MSDPLRSLLKFIPFQLALSVVVFLLASQWLDAWEGKVTSRAAEPQGDLQLVGIELENEEWTTRRWPSDIVKQLDVRSEARLAPPLVAPDNAPQTSKSRFSLSFQVWREGKPMEVPTTSPGSLGVALLAFFGGIALRNMYVSGSPIGLHPRDRIPPDPVPRSGQIQRTASSKGEKTWPQRRSKGKR